MPNGFQTEDADANANAQPSYPKSLFLIQPLHTGYEMNPVGYRAQESVKVPEGLDLDSVLVPTTNEHNAEDEYDEGMLTSEDEVDLGEGGGQGLEELRRVLRASEGKEKVMKRKKGKKDGLEETPEERLAVCFSYRSLWCAKLSVIPTAEGRTPCKAERRPILSGLKGRG
jgi:AP-3 complex subunit delta-1